VASDQEIPTWNTWSAYDSSSAQRGFKVVVKRIGKYLHDMADDNTGSVQSNSFIPARLPHQNSQISVKIDGSNVLELSDS